MVEGEIDLVVVSFVDSCYVFGKFLDKWNEDETEEGFWNVSLANDVMNLLNKEDSDERNTSKRDDDGKHTLEKCELLLGNIAMTIVVHLLILGKDLIEDRMCAESRIEDVDDEGDHENDGGSVRDAKRVMVKLFHSIGNKWL